MAVMSAPQTSHFIVSASWSSDPLATLRGPDGTT